MSCSFFGFAVRRVLRVALRVLVVVWLWLRVFGCEMLFCVVVFKVCSSLHIDGVVCWFDDC